MEKVILATIGSNDCRRRTLKAWRMTEGGNNSSHEKWWGKELRLSVNGNRDCDWRGIVEVTGY